MGLARIVLTVVLGSGPGAVHAEIWEDLAPEKLTKLRGLVQSVRDNPHSDVIFFQLQKYVRSLNPWWV